MLNTASQDVAIIARQLRVKCTQPGREASSSVQMLPITDVCQARERLCSIHENDHVLHQFAIDPRTLEKRLEYVLARKGILLKKLTYRLRCYVSVTQVEDLLSSIATSSSKTKSEWVRPCSNEITACFDLVGKRFQDRKEMYWEGEWSLASEIVGIPGALWTDTMLTMASKKRTTTWTIAAKASGARILNIFTVSNSSECIPKPSIEEALNKGSDYTRTDLLLCVRVLKVIEQLVLIRTNGVSGPLTVTASVAGICAKTTS